MKPSFYARYRLGIFAFFLLTAPLVVSSAMRAVESSSTRVADWLPESFEETQRLRWFQKHFVSDDLLMVSWDGCTLDDPRLPALAARLRQPVDVGQQHQAVLCRQIITGPEALEQLRGEPLQLSRPAALMRLRGWLVGEDQETTCMVLLMSDEGWQHRHFFLEHVYECAAEVADLDRPSVHAGGSTADAVAVDHASQEGLMWRMVLCYGVGIALMGVMFRSLVMTATVFVTAWYCQQLSLAIVESSGGHLDSVMLMIPSLLYVLSISTGIHLANYYRDSVEAQGPSDATRQAVRQAWLPCGLASVTTALGLSSLGVSFLIPVRNFGLYAAVSVLLATAVVFLLMPALLEQFPISRRRSRGTSESNGPSHEGWDGWMRKVSAWRNWILVSSFLGLGISVWGGTQIRAGAQLHDLFSPEASILQDYDWLESHIGPLVPLEIVLRIPKSEGEPRVTIMDRFRVVGAVHAVVEKNPRIGAVVSSLNFAPRVERRGGSARRVAREALFNKQLEKNRDQFVEMALLRETPTEELWRVSARAYAKDALDYAVLLEELQEAVDPLLQRSAEMGIGEVRAVYCGGVPLVQKAQEQMLEDLIHSFVLAFGLIAVMMIGLALMGSGSEFSQAASGSAWLLVLCRKVLAGLVSMVPNVLPCVVVLGGMGVIGVPLEIGSIMTASVALGIAVDDTLHFITWFRRGLANGQSRVEAVRYAYARCATAMTQTSFICGLGLLTFASSSFVPISRFAWVMFAMLIAALVVVVLPAMLLSPLGGLFQRLRPPSSHENASE
ncbi:MAG: MMPL family transporter [Planctomycetes bacterium]|nr:MMPL family transporter [Planctomycetota bacterium]